MTLRRMHPDTAKLFPAAMRRAATSESPAQTLAGALQMQMQLQPIDLEHEHNEALGLGSTALSREQSAKERTPRVVNPPSFFAPNAQVPAQAIPLATEEKKTENANAPVG